MSTRFSIFTAAAAASAILVGCATTETKNTVQRMYVIPCGENRTTDVSLWSPGFDVGKPMEFSNNCYLIRHAQGWMLWDTGNSDALAARPDGLTVLGGRLNIRMPKTLASQLKELGVEPADVKVLAMSHMHGDHCGNANYFTAATLYIQEVEYNAAFGPEPQKLGFVPANYEKLRSSKVVKLNGDHDVFGDGSVVIKSAPGHTPGHQVLVVRLPKTGAVLLSCDMVHFQENWVKRRVPGMNFNRDQSTVTMETIAAFMTANKVELWINHDKAQSDRLPKAPKHVE
jgi:glyoxylase-like metal-dependent hydrolase (beta-lactamase superfamily II)